jgi:hypothetical protein
MVALGLDPRLAEALLEAGASNNAADKIGWTVRLRAAKFASVDTLRAVMHPKPKSSRQWQVVVDTSVEVLGLQIEDGPGRSLRVIGISHESAMDIFNQMNPRDKVSPGDLIIRVNGTDESLEALWDAICASLEEFVLVLLNGPEAQSYGEDDLPDGLV